MSVSRAFRHGSTGARSAAVLVLSAIALASRGDTAPPLIPSPGWTLHGSACPRGAATDQAAYFPGPGDEWERRAPASLGLEPARLDAAVAWAVEHESDFGPDLESSLRARLAGEPFNEIIGPMKERGPANGLIVHRGYIVAEWGETRRVDMTFSVTKSFLSTLAGLAVDSRLIADPGERVGTYVLAERFRSPQNAPITWHHLLQQTSEWEGTLWGKPDVADRRRGRDRELNEPGSFWEYNDVRVNLTALALLHLFREPLPDVLESQVMDPIDASDTWRWHGYRNSYVTIDGRRVGSVSGGGHWGGGMWISSRDLARFGYLFLRCGRWRGREIISTDWVRATITPSPQNPRYGYMWWLNTDRSMWPSAPATSFAALGGGTNAVWVDPGHDLVVVVRWIDGAALDELLRLILASGSEWTYLPG